MINCTTGLKQMFYLFWVFMLIMSMLIQDVIALSASLFSISSFILVEYQEFIYGEANWIYNGYVKNPIYLERR